MNGYKRRQVWRDVKRELPWALPVFVPALAALIGLVAGMFF